MVGLGSWPLCSRGMGRDYTGKLKSRSMFTLAIVRWGLILRGTTPYLHDFIPFLDLGALGKTIPKGFLY